MRSALHPWLKPSGYIGQTAGILSLFIFISLWLYPLRRRFRWLSFTGTMSKWFNVHVVMALLLPLMAAVHASWRFRGLIGLGYFAMLAVWLSGLVGRYLYTRIPRGRTGLELGAEEVAKARHALLSEIAKRARLPVEEVQTLLGEDPFPAKGSASSRRCGNSSATISHAGGPFARSPRPAPEAPVDGSSAARCAESASSPAARWP